MTTVPFHKKRSAATLVAALRGDPHAPMSAMIEIADRCNEVCVHCYQVQGQKGEIGTEDWKQILDELADMGVLFLTISGGEATLRKDFLELVEHARARKFAVKLYTNGLTMTAELAARLAELAVQEVQISLYSHRPEVHDWVTRVPGSWEKTVEGARALVALGVPVLLKSPLMTFNAEDYREYAEFVTALGASYSFDPTLDAREDGDRDPERLRIDEERYLRVAGDPLVSGPRRGERPVRDLGASVCGACSGNVHIEANGEMRPCTQLGVPVGHALRDGIRNAWENNPEGRAIRALTWNDLSGCRVCDLASFCTRCFASARVETGDALAPYPSACARARLGWQIAHDRAPVIEGDAPIGPYREVEPGRFVAAPVDGNGARDAALEWTRRDPAPQVDEAPIAPGQLVQIRRPGARRAGWERVPARAEGSRRD